MDTIANAEKLLDVAIHAADADDRTDARVKIIAALNERERLREALREILTEAEFVADAKAPFSTWVAGKCRAALNQPETTNTHIKGETQ